MLFSYLFQIGFDLRELPDGILEPFIQKETTSSEPIAYFAVSAPDKTLEQLSWFVDDSVTKRLLSMTWLEGRRLLEEAMALGPYDLAKGAKTAEASPMMIAIARNNAAMKIATAFSSSRRPSTSGVRNWPSMVVHVKA